MNNISTYQAGLPSNIEDLSKFVLIGREKMVAIRAEIRAIDKLGLAKGVRRQKLEEAQMISEAVLDAEVRIGSLTSLLPKASSGDRKSDGIKICTAEHFEKPKSESIRALGFSQSQIQRFETLAKHPEIVEQAKADARASEDIISRSLVLSKIAELKKPYFIMNNDSSNEWYTPKEYIDAAREVMGGIDLDPASSDLANKIVQADTYYTIEMDGLKLPWSGRIWLNPPYSADLIPLFISKLKVHVDSKEIEQAIVLVNNATETAWFHTLISCASAVVFPKGRIKYYMPDRKTGSPLQGQAFVYVGAGKEKFAKIFGQFGWSAVIV